MGTLPSGEDFTFPDPHPGAWGLCLPALVTIQKAASRDRQSLTMESRTLPSLGEDFTFERFIDNNDLP